MLLGQIVEHVDQRHRVPTNRAPPEFGRGAGGRVGPALLLGGVPAVIQKASLGVARVLLDQRDLFDDLVVGRRIVEGAAELGQERRGHVRAVEPHLIRINLLVPEAAVHGARLRFELALQEPQRLGVALALLGVGRARGQPEQQLA